MKDKLSFSIVTKYTASKFPDDKYICCVEDIRGRFQNLQKVIDCAHPYDE